MFEKLKKRIEALDDRWHHLAEWHTEGSNAVLEFYVKILPKTADAERCNIFIRVPTSEGIWLKVGTGETEREIKLSEDADPVVTEVITTGKARLISSHHQDADDQESDSTGDVLCIPLKSLDGKEIVGAVQLMDKRGSASFDDLDRESVEEVAHYLEVRFETIFFNIQPADMTKSIVDAVNIIIIVTLGILVSLSLLLAAYWAILS